MGEVDLRGFSRALRGVRQAGVDTPVWIYHLEDVRPYSELTTHLLAEAASETRQLILSVVSVSEILVGPWRARDRERARLIEEALQSIPGVTEADVTWEVATRSAELRGRTGLPLPDALIIASGLSQQAQLLITNDAAWRAVPLPCRVLLLDDYAKG